MLVQKYSQIHADMHSEKCAYLMYNETKYSQIQADMHIKNGANMQVCCLKIHSNTCRYAHLNRCISDSDSIFLYLGKLF